jgi:hypothetical protein
MKSYSFHRPPVYDPICGDTGASGKVLAALKRCGYETVRFHGLLVRRQTTHVQPVAVQQPASNLLSNKSHSRNGCEGEAAQAARSVSMASSLDRQRRIRGDRVIYTRDTCLTTNAPVFRLRTMWPCRYRLVTRHLDHQGSSARVYSTSISGPFAENVLCPSVDGGSPPQRVCTLA